MNKYAGMNGWLMYEQGHEQAEAWAGRGWTPYLLKGIPGCTVPSPTHEGGLFLVWQRQEAQNISEHLREKDRALGTISAVGAFGTFSSWQHRSDRTRGLVSSSSWILSFIGSSLPLLSLQVSWLWRNLSSAPPGCRPFLTDKNQISCLSGYWVQIHLVQILN